MRKLRIHAVGAIFAPVNAPVRKTAETGRMARIAMLVAFAEKYVDDGSGVNARFRDHPDWFSKIADPAEPTTPVTPAKRAKPIIT